MSNLLWKIRFSNYKPIDLRDIESYSIKQNVDGTSPVKEEEKTKEIKQFLKDRLLFLHEKAEDFIEYKGLSDNKKVFSLLDFHETFFSVLLLDNELSKDDYSFIFENKDLIISILCNTTNSDSILVIHSLKTKEELLKPSKNIDEFQRIFILKNRQKLFTVEFKLKEKKVVNWGAYKTKEEAEIVYNKVDSYFKKTFDHFYKNSDNQEIYSL